MMAYGNKQQAWTYKEYVEQYEKLVAACEELKVTFIKLCEEAYKEGYVGGYEDGNKVDESCTPETTIFQNDLEESWNQSATKAAIDGVQKESTSVQPKVSEGSKCK